MWESYLPQARAIDAAIQAAAAKAHSVPPIDEDMPAIVGPLKAYKFKSNPRTGEFILNFSTDIQSVAALISSETMEEIVGTALTAAASSRPRSTEHELSYAVLSPDQLALAATHRPGEAVLVISIGALNLGFATDLESLRRLLDDHIAQVVQGQGSNKPN